MDLIAQDIDSLQQLSDAIFAEWVKATGLHVTRVTAEDVQMCLPLTPSVSHIPQTVSGQALLALADSAMVLALANHYKQFRPVATVDLHMQFMKAARGNVLVRARVERATRSIAFASAHFSLEGEEDKEIGRAIGTFSIPAA